VKVSSLLLAAILSSVLSSVNSLCMAGKAVSFSQTFTLQHRKTGPPYDRKWTVTDGAFKVFNPSPSGDNRIGASLTAVDNPTFRFKDGSTGTFTFSKINAKKYERCLTQVGLLGYSFFNIALDAPSETQGEWIQQFTLTVESEEDIAFYMYGPSNGFTVTGHDSLTPNSAYHNAWKVFDSYIPVVWDSDLKIWLAPYANFWIHETTWEKGWQTVVEVTNQSGSGKSYDIVNQRYGGAHGHSGTSPAGECEESKTTCGLCDRLHIYTTIIDSFSVGNGASVVRDAFRFHISESGARSNHDSHVVIYVSGDNPSGSTIKVRVYPNSSGTRCTPCN
jgi:hypothetical protein